MQKKIIKSRELIDRGLTKLLLTAVTMEVDPQLASNVIFHTWILFIVQPVQCTAHYRVNLTLDDADSVSLGSTLTLKPSRNPKTKTASPISINHDLPERW